MLTEKFLFFLVTIIIPEQGPFLKDQVTERGESTRGWVPFTDPVWSSYSPKSSSSNSQQATIKLAPRFDGEPIFTDQAGEDTNDNLLQPRLDSGPTFKDQVHAVYCGPTFKDQAHTAVPGAAAVPGPGKAQREDSEGASQSSVEAEDEESQWPDPALIQAVVVDSKAILQAEEVVVENKMRKRCLLAFVILVLVTAGVVAGVCGDGSCSGKRSVTPPPDPPPDNSTWFSCDLDLETLCFVENKYLTLGEPCDMWTLTIPVPGPCLYRPMGATLLFNGGDCFQSDNQEILNFTCNDFNGGPPTLEGEEVYIEVTDDGSNGNVLFQGPVRVNDLFLLTNNGNLFADEQLISIFHPDGITPLQEIRCSLTCSSDLELGNRFGSVQPVEFYNEEQDLVSLIATFSYVVTLKLYLAIVVRLAGESATLTELVAITNFAGEFDLTELVQNQTIDLQHPIQQLALSGNVSSETQVNYTIDYVFEGVSNPDGAFCNGTDTSWFLFPISDVTD